MVMRRRAGSAPSPPWQRCRSSPSPPTRCQAMRQRPAKPAATATSPNPSARASSSPRSANFCHRTAGMRQPPLVLVVDDVPDNVDILQMRLESQGYEVIAAADGEQALAIVRERLPDLVLMDIMMPKLDGIAAMKQLKADPSLPFLPVILVTARADTKDVIAGIEAGGDDYLTKPVDQAALMARVRAMLRIKALHDRVQEQGAELAEWNRKLEERVAAQLGEIERAARLRRFLAPQLAELIVSS